jgi:CheY-like chemotaxis protein
VPVQTAQSQASPSRPEPASPLDHARVLIVDDSRTNRALAVALLEAAGAVCHTAQGGGEAIDVCGVQGFDAILMDLRMPDMPGLAVARTIRQGPGPNRLTPILAFTADDGAADADDPVFSGRVEKPMTMARLFMALATAIARGRRLSSAVRVA